MRHSSRFKSELLRQLELLSPVDRRVLAKLWAVSAPNASAIAMAMTNPAQVAALWQRLNDETRAALTRLLQDGGALPVATMHRLFGGVREPGGFAHPRAYLDALNTPATPTETLYNYGLIFRAHDARGALYRVPSDLLPLLPDVPPRDRRLHVALVATPFGQIEAPRAESLVVLLLTLAYAGTLKTLDDGSLNKASLAAIVKQIEHAPDLRAVRREADWPLVALVRAAAVEAGLLKRSEEQILRPTPRAIEWLQLPHAERARVLLNGWCGSPVDELTVLCGLHWRGGTPYTLNRTAPRRNLLRLLATLPADQWIDLASIMDEVQRVEPDFQRRDGRYDTWLLYNDRDELVSPWERWCDVEGGLIRQVICGPLAWLGLFDHDAAQRAVRVTPLGAHLLADVPAPPEPPTAPLIVQSTFEVLVPLDAAPYARFQLARVADLTQAGALTIYKLTRSALLAAVERGINVEDVLRFLADQSAGPLPPAVPYTLREWSGQADQVRLTDAVLLYAADPVILAQLRANKDLKLNDVDQLDPQTLRLPDGNAHDLAERLRRAGFGVRDERIDPHLPLDEKDLRALVMAATVYARICTELGLPSEVSPALLNRLCKLVPARCGEIAADAAELVAAELARREEREGEAGRQGEGETRDMRHASNDL